MNLKNIILPLIRYFGKQKTLIGCILDSALFLPRRILMFSSLLAYVTKYEKWICVRAQ